MSWLPQGKQAAVCFTIDDVHPGRSDQHYDGGGDLGKGALGHLQRLLERHPSLHMTLFCTADWREISPTISRRVIAKVPIARDRLFLSPILPKGARRIDRHREFVRYLQSLPRTEIAPHGLHHIHPGPLLHVEFQDHDSYESCVDRLREMLSIFDRSGLSYARGMSPPGWNAPSALLDAMCEVGLQWVASARDIKTPISSDAKTAMSGLHGMPLIAPGWTARNRLVHLPTNFQATSPIERAIEIVEAGGLLSIKAHILKNAMGHIALDGVDGVYCNYLDLLFTELERRYGDRLWWTTMGEIAAQHRRASIPAEQHAARA